MENCKGCLSLRWNCYCMGYVGKLKCPCAICLIKIVCTDPCDDFKSFSSEHMKERYDKLIEDCYVRRELKRDTM